MEIKGEREEHLESVIQVLELCAFSGQAKIELENFGDSLQEDPPKSHFLIFFFQNKPWLLESWA